MDKTTKIKDKMRKTSMCSHKLTKEFVLPTISARFPVSGGIYENGPRNIALQESFWSFRASLFPCHTKSSARAQRQRQRQFFASTTLKIARKSDWNSTRKVYFMVIISHLHQKISKKLGQFTKCLYLCTHFLCTYVCT